MEPKVWEIRKNKHYEAYNLALNRWTETREPFFKREMNYCALQFRICRAYASQAANPQDQKQSRVLGLQGH